MSTKRSRFSLSLVILASLRSTSAVDVSIALAAPNNAPTMSKSLVSLSIEQDRWVEWAGMNSRNQFFYNTFSNLRDLTGSPPDVRIGANSEDHTDFNPTLKFSQAIFPAPTDVVPYPEALNISVGDGFYEAAKFLVPGTHVTFGVNFGRNNLTAAFLETKSILKAFSTSAIKNAGIVLDFIEIGNEPDLYRNNGLRAPDYSVSDYIPEWTEFAKNVSAAAGISASSHTKLIAASFAGNSHANGFFPQALFDGGLLDSPEGKLISTISQHRYSGSFCSGNGALLRSLMSKSSIRGNISVFAQDIVDAKAQGLRYILGETNSLSCHGAPGVSNTAGAALWAIDYVLTAVKSGIEQVFFHDGIGFKYNLIQPVTLDRSITDATPLPEPIPPHVQPQYYAAIILSEVNGRIPTKVVEISVDNDEITGWGFYQGSRLKQAVFIHLNAFLSSSDSRATEHVGLSFTGGLAPKTMTIKRLNIGHADDTSGVTYGGQTYETKDGKVSGGLHVENGSVNAGFDLHATEAVVVTFA